MARGRRGFGRDVPRHPSPRRPARRRGPSRMRRSRPRRLPAVRRAAQGAPRSGSGTSSSMGGLWVVTERDVIPFDKQSTLQAEHLLVLLGFAMVVAEQMQEAMHCQQVDLVGGRMTCRGSLLNGNLGAQRDVAEIAFRLSL